MTTALLAGCVMSMSPVEFVNTFPKSTESRFYNLTNADDALSNGQCRLLVTGRSYAAPVGLTVQSDVNYGAQGVDEWVQVDGGNAYRMTNFKWINLLDGSTQLVVYFDTMDCEKPSPRQIGV